ncbi:MAG: Maf family protein [Planctomycetota bacterium]|nr:Maf family protein [Planctomycetota bacterium]
MRLILASSSPRRAELLEKAGLVFEVMKPQATLEDAYSAAWSHLDPEEFSRRLAFLKALGVARALPAQEAVVLGADTIAEFEGDILGKPRDRSDAQRMIKRLCNADHDVITGIALISLETGLLVTEAVRSTVSLGPYNETLVADYVAAGLADGKAGSYGIQDPLIRPLILGVEGPFDNVIGLPVETVKGHLKTWSTL